MTLNIMTLSITIKKRDARHNDIHNCYAERHLYSECHLRWVSQISPLCWASLCWVSWRPFSTTPSFDDLRFVSAADADDDLSIFGEKVVRSNGQMTFGFLTAPGRCVGTTVSQTTFCQLFKNCVELWLPWLVDMIRSEVVFLVMCNPSMNELCAT
jgi:hypothetical protein